MDPQTTFDSDTILRKIACTWLFLKIVSPYEISYIERNLLLLSKLVKRLQFHYHAKNQFCIVYSHELFFSFINNIHIYLYMRKCVRILGQRKFPET